MAPLFGKPLMVDISIQATPVSSVSVLMMSGLIKAAPGVSAIDEGRQALINDYHLQQNYPNPFNPFKIIMLYRKNVMLS